MFRYEYGNKLFFIIYKMEISSPRFKKSSSSPISSDVRRNIEQQKKNFSKGEINLERFNKTATRSFMTNGRDIQVKLKTEDGKSIKKNYRIIDSLGEGAFGMTYIAMDTDEKKLYVIKFQSKKYSKKEIKCLRVVKPICGEYILCYVGHFDFNIDFNVFSGIVTDYQENLVTLDEYLIKRQQDKNQNLSLDEKEDILKNVQITADKLSNLGIIHNDLHYGNLLWNISDGTQKGMIKIIDFGLCKFETNIQNAKKENNKWIDKLSESLNTFLSNSDKKKLNVSKSPNKKKELGKRIISLKTSHQSKEDSLAKRIRELRFTRSTDKPGKEELLFDFKFPSIPKKKFTKSPRSQ